MWNPPATNIDLPKNEAIWKDMLLVHVNQPSKLICWRIRNPSIFYAEDDKCMFVTIKIHQIEKEVINWGALSEGDLVFQYWCSRNGRLNLITKGFLVYTVVAERVWYFLLLNYSYKSWSIIKIRESSEICSSWGFQNCPWKLNLTKIWLR